MAKKTREKKFSSSYRVSVDGIVPILFNRFVSTKAETTPTQKLYLDDGVVSLPGANILSFLTSPQNGKGCPGSFAPNNKKTTMTRLARAYLRVEGWSYPFMRDGKPVKFGEFNGSDTDKISGMKVLTHTGRCKGNIPVENIRRPCLSLPWSLTFGMAIINHPELPFEMARSWIERGGIEIGWGDFRPFYGAFRVTDIKAVA